MSRPDRSIHVVAALAECGGAASWADLSAATSPGMVRAAERRGCITRLRRGTYVLPELLGVGPMSDSGARPWGRLATAPTPQESARLVRARVVARAHGAVLSHRSAAAQYDWAFFEAPRRLEVVLPRGHRPLSAPFLHARWRHVEAHERHEGVTDPMRTLLHCATDLPFAVALGVADSAVRSGVIDRCDLRRLSETQPGPGAERVRRVVRYVDPRAANPFESAMRAVALDIPGLLVEPQVVVEGGGFFARVDLADRAHRIAIEADSYEFHGGAEAFARDCARYDELVARGWLVLRVTVADVRDRPGWVRETLLATLRQRTDRAPARA